MNYQKSIKVILVSLVFIITSCGTDDETSNNIISFNGGQFRLYKGYQYKYSSTIPETGSTPFVVMLLGDGVSYDQSSSVLSGTGSLISFYMYSETDAEIKQGDYTIDIFSRKPIFSADSCFILYNYDFSQDTGKLFNIKGGTFNVKNLGSVMSYEISLVTDTILFKGDFKGPIQTL